MGEQEPLIENTKFGRYLRRVREDRRLSLDAVEEMTVNYPGRVTKSHLSRIENGQAVPTFPRMFALSQIYGVPISFFAERFEMDLRAELTLPEVWTRDRASLLEEMLRLRVHGRYPEALALCEALIERETLDAKGERAAGDDPEELRLIRIECLYRIGRYGLAKEDCEEVLNRRELSPAQRLVALHHFVVCSFRLQRFEIALMGLDQANRTLSNLKGDPQPIVVRMEAELAAVQGNIHHALQRWPEAIEAHRTALKLYEKLELPFEACRNRINITSSMIELGQMTSAKRMLRDALSAAESAGYDRQRALALSNLGLIAFKTGDLAAAESYCVRSNNVARPREFQSVLFRNCYYLWQVARTNEDHAAERAYERSLRSYLGRIEEPFEESETFRAYLAGGK